MSLTVGIHAHFESAVAEGRMVRTVVYWPVQILRNLLMIPATVNAAQLLAEAYSSHPCTVKSVFAGPCAKRNPVLTGQFFMHQSAVDRTCISGSSGILSYQDSFHCNKGVRLGQVLLYVCRCSFLLPVLSSATSSKQCLPQCDVWSVVHAGIRHRQQAALLYCNST